MKFCIFFFSFVILLKFDRQLNLKYILLSLHEIFAVLDGSSWNERQSTIQNSSVQMSH